MRPKEPNILSDNTIEVIKLLSQGYSYKEIAIKCNKARVSVDSQLVLARKKLNAKNNVHLIMIALQKGYINVNYVNT